MSAIRDWQAASIPTQAERPARCTRLAGLWLLVGLLTQACTPQALVGTAQAGENPRDSQPWQASVELQAASSRPVNPYLLGNNVQWVDRGDEMLGNDSLALRADMLSRARELGVSVLRYPGGSLSDLYHWQDGMGPRQARGENSRFHGAGGDRVLFGTREFLMLSRALGAEPLITVNVITGTAEEAAAWVRQTNVTGLQADGEPLPRVRYWEIGNEPYLVDDNQRALAISPEDFADRASAFIRAMKAVDPSIQVGLPLRSDTLGGVPATPLPGYNAKVLEGVDAPIDFVSVHNAYYPYIFGELPDRDALWRATMAATAVVREDFERTRQQVDRLRPEADLPIALTEYNALFTLGQGASDSYLASLTGALFVADLLLTLGPRDDLLMANYWSLSGNWYFGAIDQNGRPRPAFHVLEGFQRFWRGQQVGVRVTAPSFAAPAAGFVPARQDIPLLNAGATRENGTLRLLLLNKHASAPAELRLTGAGLESSAASARRQTLAARDAFSAEELDWSAFEALTADTLLLPPQSLTLVEISGLP